MTFLNENNENSKEFFLKTSEQNLDFHPSIVFISIVVVPSILSGIFFYVFADFQGLSFQMAMLLTIAILMNFYLFYKNRKWYQNQIKLLIAFDEIQIIQKGKIYWKEELVNVEMTIEKMIDNQISIIKIVNHRKEAIYIGHQKNKKLQTQKSSYLITSETDWIQLLNLLSN